MVMRIMMNRGDFDNEAIENIKSCKQYLRSYLRAHDVMTNLMPYWPGMFISGGAIASILQQEEPKDVDIWFKDVNTEILVVDTIKRFPEMIQDVNECYEAITLIDGKNITANAITLASKNLLPGGPVQLITIMVGSPDKIRSTFDFIHCCPWYDLSKDTLYISAKQYRCIKSKFLVKHFPNGPDPKSWRVAKFQKRGYVWGV
jgi:hypothetical protein